MIPYKLNRSKRKTIAVYVRNGGVEVRAPLKVSKRDIDNFVLSKEKWITDQLMVLGKRQEQRRAFRLDYGCRVLYCGREYPIVARTGDRAGFDEERFHMPPGLNMEQIKHACIRIYHILARHDLTNKVLDYARQMGVMPTAVKINAAKTRWGSCSGKNSLNFSWQLIMADEDVIDYVIVHELAHIKEHNHSGRFWTVVSGVLPDYRERQLKLKAFQKRIGSEDWG